MSVDTLMHEEELVEEGSGGRKGLFIAVVLVVLLGGGAAAWWFLWDGAAADVEPRDGEVVILESLTTTLGESSLRHARVTLAIVLVEGEDADVLEPYAPMLQDALLREIAQLDADQLRSSEGSDELRRRLTAEAQGIWGEEVVRRVLLTELLIQ